MEGNSIVFWFSIVVFVCVFAWAFLMVKAYDKTPRD